MSESIATPTPKVKNSVLVNGKAIQSTGLADYLVKTFIGKPVSKSARALFQERASLGEVLSKILKNAPESAQIELRTPTYSLTLSPSEMLEYSEIKDRLFNDQHVRFLGTVQKSVEKEVIELTSLF